MLPSPGDVRNIRDETCPLSRDESGDKTNLRDRLSIRPPTDEEPLGTSGPPDDLRPSGSNTTPMVTDTKLGGTSLARQLLRSTRTGLLMMVKHFENTVVTDRAGWQVVCGKRGYRT